MTRPDKFVRLADHVSLCRLESPSLYDRRADELYELNDDGLNALLLCDGGRKLSQAGLDDEFLAFCLAEGLLDLLDEPRPRPLSAASGPSPSLRYLEAQITWRCNLACRHCYLGQARAVDMPVERFAALVREFQAMGGLRLLISGGEPLAHPQWPLINACLAALPVRRVLLTNGLLLGPELIDSLQVDEIQISLDGMEAGHELLRGAGSFRRAVAAARLVREHGLDLSVATMAHAGNLAELDDLAALVRELGAQEWGVDAPCLAGRLAENDPLAVTPEQGAQAMTHAFGGAFHGGSDGMACGLHLCTVAPDGRVAQCGFYLDTPLGQASEGLWACWARREPLALADIQVCGQCPEAEECGGGCRFRAGGPLAPDPVMCAAMGRPLP